MANLRRWTASAVVLFAIAHLAKLPHAAPQAPANTPAPTGPIELVEKLNRLRKDYQKTLEQLHAHYYQAQDKEKQRWAYDELMNFHRIPKHAFILDMDVPPEKLKDVPHKNVPEANNLFTWALQYKDRGFGTEYIDNQRRAEVLFQDILSKYPTSDKISDVAFMLGDIYESKAYRQYYRAVEYYQRCFQWNPKTSHEARIRAARLFDRQLNNREKAVKLYQEVTTHEIDPRRKEEARKRLAELGGTR